MNQLSDAINRRLSQSRAAASSSVTSLSMTNPYVMPVDASGSLSLHPVRNINTSDNNESKASSSVGILATQPSYQFNHYAQLPQLDQLSLGSILTPSTATSRSPAVSPNPKRKASSEQHAVARGQNKAHKSHYHANAGSDNHSSFLSVTSLVSPSVITPSARSGSESQSSKDAQQHVNSFAGITGPSANAQIILSRAASSPAVVPDVLVISSSQSAPSSLMGSPDMVTTRIELPVGLDQGKSGNAYLLTTDAEIFDRVRKIMKRDGVRQRNLARSMGISPSTLSPILKGTYQHTKPVHVRALRNWCYEQDVKLWHKAAFYAGEQNIREDQLASHCNMDPYHFSLWLTFSLPIKFREPFDVAVLQWIHLRNRAAFEECSGDSEKYKHLVNSRRKAMEAIDLVPATSNEEPESVVSDHSNDVESLSEYSGQFSFQESFPTGSPSSIHSINVPNLALLSSPSYGLSHNDVTQHLVSAMPIPTFNDQSRLLQAQQELIAAQSRHIQLLSQHYPDINQSRAQVPVVPSPYYSASPTYNSQQAFPMTSSSYPNTGGTMLGHCPIPSQHSTFAEVPASTQKCIFSNVYCTQPYGYCQCVGSDQPHWTNNQPINQQSSINMSVQHSPTAVTAGTVGLNTVPSVNNSTNNEFTPLLCYSLSNQHPPDMQLSWSPETGDNSMYHRSSQQHP